MAMIHQRLCDLEADGSRAAADFFETLPINLSRVQMIGIPSDRKLKANRNCTARYLHRGGAVGKQYFSGDIRKLRHHGQVCSVTN
ncbi:MAG TPA: hypothetical protein VN612_12150 [Acidobacteriaceae bacterium]|nr:hypothetical protein [Acidobacteriaceae bacterium]